MGAPGPTSELHIAWERWRFRDGAEPMSQKAFGQALDRLGHPAGGAVRGKRWRKGIAPHEKAGLAVDDE
jgi:putative DNA primase/helicase